MSITGVLNRFFLAYILFMLVTAVSLHLLEITTNSGVNVGILAGAILWSCMAFSTKTGQPFTPEQKTKVVRGMITINLAIQLVAGGGALAVAGKISVGPLLIAVALVGALHSVLIYYFVGLNGKLFLKQQAKKEAAAG
jgi:hypothetical protein